MEGNKGKMRPLSLNRIIFDCHCCNLIILQSHPRWIHSNRLAPFELTSVDPFRPLHPLDPVRPCTLCTLCTLRRCLLCDKCFTSIISRYHFVIVRNQSRKSAIILLLCLIRTRPSASFCCIVSGGKLKCLVSAGRIAVCEQRRDWRTTKLS